MRMSNCSDKKDFFTYQFLCADLTQDAQGHQHRGKQILKDRIEGSESGCSFNTFGLSSQSCFGNSVKRNITLGLILRFLD